MTTPTSPRTLSVAPYAILSGPQRDVCYEPWSGVGALPPVESNGCLNPIQNDANCRSLWRESLALVERFMTFDRRTLREGELVYQCSQSFDTLYLVNSGLFKIINLTPDGRQQTTGLYFKGDWLGFDGIPTGRYACSALTLDRSEVWAIRYDALLEASAKQPALMRLVLAALSAQLAHNRDVTMSIGTLSADARVADFLLQWTFALSERGMRTDQINVHMSRADMGNYLGLSVESVSRALSRLARVGVIEFNERARRDISIPNLGALRNYIQSSTDSTAPLLQ